MTPAQLFLHGQALPFLLLGPLVWAGLRALDRGRKRRLARFLGPRAHWLAAERPRGRRGLKRVLFGLGLVFTIAAALGPAFGGPSPDVEWRGVDLVVGLDVSRSMLARDVDPDRLARAKREIHALAARAQGDRVALVLFAGSARLVVPLTRDLASMAELADRAEPASVARGGTDLAAALEVCLRALESRGGDSSAIVLLTDGEDHGGRGARAAEACRADGVVVHAVGLGTRLGSKIVTDDGAPSAFVRDRSGLDVVSAMDAESLTRLAEASGGIFMDAGVHEAPLVELYESQILPLARQAYRSEGLRRRKNHYQGFLLVAFALWVVAFAVSEGRRP